MKAVVIHAYGGPEVLKYEDYPDAVAGPGYVLVRVAATSINPIDLKIRSGAVKEFFPVAFPGILGLDLSGTVEAVGSGVETFAPGDKVFAHAPQAYASFCVVKASELARIPTGMDPGDAAALPTVTMTGAQLAELALDGQPGRTVLVTGAVGNVGRSAVFAAKDQGAFVIAGVLGRQFDAAKAVGADRIIVLDDEKSVASLDPLDAVASTVSGPVADQLVGKIKAGGIFASVVGPPGNANTYPAVRVATMQVKAVPATLLRMAQAVKAGKLVIPVGQRFALADASKAHLAAEKGASGKLLLIP
jgi:NADPH:quinone reductase-like Zn-dependent oxidoreductase